MSLLIVSVGGRIPGFNFSIGGWFICSLILFIMIFTVVEDFSKLQAATQAAVERRQNGLANGSLVTIKEVDATPLEAISLHDKEVDVTPLEAINVNDVEVASSNPTQSATVRDDSSV